MDKISGKDFERPQYRKMLRRMMSGDVLVIKSIDRLGRPPLPVPEGFEQVSDRWAKGEISSRKAALQLGLSQNTFLRRARKRLYIDINVKI